MFYTDIDESQAKQSIDAEQVRKAWLSLEKRTRDYRGGMCWKTVKGREYLYREYGGGRGKSLGPRSDETEKIIGLFKAGKSSVDQDFERLTGVLKTHARVNVALRVGRTPNIVVETLESLRKAGLQDHFIVIGTNALYAYETHAGVRFDGDITATTDVDLLWDSRKHLTLASDCDADFAKNGLIGLLKKIDPSFRLVEDQEYRAANANGYMVDLIKRRPESLF
jgi:hypothetical protein